MSDLWTTISSIFAIVPLGKHPLLDIFSKFHTNLDAVKTKMSWATTCIKKAPLQCGRHEVSWCCARGRALWIYPIFESQGSWSQELQNRSSSGPTKRSFAFVLLSKNHLRENVFVMYLARMRRRKKVPILGPPVFNVLLHSMEKHYLCTNQLR